MRFLPVATAALFAAALAYGGLAAGRKTGSSGNGHWEMAKGLDDAFLHTANLRSGAGRCGAGHVRRPGVPTVFHVEKRERREIPANLRFQKDETAEVWSLAQPGSALDASVPYGSLFYADAAKKRSAGHYLVTSGAQGFGRWEKIDAQYLAGEYQGTAFRGTTKIADDGSGSVKAVGTDPQNGRYALSGAWDASNVGTWSQRWTHSNGAWEKDDYRTAADGTAVLNVVTVAGLELELRFATDRSGRGTVENAKGLTGKVEWDNQGDGTILWADGATQGFENWRV